MYLFHRFVIKPAVVGHDMIGMSIIYSDIITSNIYNTIVTAFAFNAEIGRVNHLLQHHYINVYNTIITASALNAKIVSRRAINVDSEIINSSVHSIFDFVTASIIVNPEVFRIHISCVQELVIARRIHISH